MKGNITGNTMNCDSIHAETLRNKTNINDIKIDMAKGTCIIEENTVDK